ncbi:MAG: hypothetical protein E7442_07160 [Ruminococcaceae bacterium]|nr:hypothetical protein [Oscillospiraceae bacterium]
MILHVVEHALLESLKILPFLLLTYLAIEIIEHHAEEKTVSLINRAGRFGPVIGGVLGVIPQCGFSTATANLYAGGLITRGTLLAVFLSTSDEMLPIFLSHSLPGGFIAKILLFKAAAGMLAGFLIDALERHFGREQHRHIHDMCEREGCRCEDSVLRSALHHTLKIFLFIFAVSFVLGIVVESVGHDRLASFILNRPVAGELLAGIIGLIPNCAASVILTELYLEGGMSLGAMLSGLLVGSGVGLLVLFRMEHNWKASLQTLIVLYVSGVVLGFIGGLLPIF